MGLDSSVDWATRRSPLAERDKVAGPQGRTVLRPADRGEVPAPAAAVARWRRCCASRCRTRSTTPASTARVELAQGLKAKADTAEPKGPMQPAPGGPPIPGASADGRPTPADAAPAPQVPRAGRRCRRAAPGAKPRGCAAGAAGEEARSRSSTAWPESAAAGAGRRAARRAGLDHGADCHRGDSAAGGFHGASAAVDSAAAPARLRRSGYSADRAGPAAGAPPRHHGRGGPGGRRGGRIGRCWPRRWTRRSSRRQSQGGKLPDDPDALDVDPPAGHLLHRGRGAAGAAGAARHRDQGHRPGDRRRRRAAGAQGARQLQLRDGLPERAQEGGVSDAGGVPPLAHRPAAPRGATRTG